MMLSGCNLLPNGILPLFIFEPRYRAMIAHTLMHDRMVCIGTLTGDQGDESDAALSPFSTAGLLRACVQNPDGTFHALLEGIQRIRFTGWEQRKPFRIASIEPLETIHRDAEEVPALNQELVQSTLRYLRKTPGGAPSEVEEHLAALNCPEQITDFIAASIIRDAGITQPMLGIASLPKRMRVVLRALESPGEM